MIKLTEDRIMEIFSEASTTYNEMKQVIQNQRLQELIEKRLKKEYTKDWTIRTEWLINKLQKLLEQSKK